MHFAAARLPGATADTCEALPQWTGGGFDGARQYARDKRRQLAYTEWWAEQPANKGVGFYTMHPGLPPPPPQHPPSA